MHSFIHIFAFPHLPPAASSGGSAAGCVLLSALALSFSMSFRVLNAFAFESNIALSPLGRSSKTETNSFISSWLSFGINKSNVFAQCHLLNPSLC
jgi:hypothetical protein